MLGNLDADFATDDIRFESLERIIAKRTEFPVFMVFPFLTIDLAIGAVLAFPATSGLAIAGFVHLNIIFYGIVNDILGVRDSMEYFRFGHQPGQLNTVSIPSTNKNAQAFHWGVLATWLLSAIGASIIGFTASISAPVTPFIYPLISTLVAGVLIGAERSSKARMVNFRDNLHIPSLPSNDIEAKKNWRRCSDRNVFGYTTLPLIGVGIAVGIYTSAFNGLAAMLPTALLPLASPLMPVILGAPMVLFCNGMLINYLRDRNSIELDQTLPRKFGTNPNFIPELEQSERTLATRPDLSQDLSVHATNRTGATPAPFAPLQGVHNARVQDQGARADSATDDSARQGMSMQTNALASGRFSPGL